MQNKIQRRCNLYISIAKKVQFLNHELLYNQEKNPDKILDQKDKALHILTVLQQFISRYASTIDDEDTYQKLLLIQDKLNLIEKEEKKIQKHFSQELTKIKKDLSIVQNERKINRTYSRQNFPLSDKIGA